VKDAIIHAGPERILLFWVVMLLLRDLFLWLFMGDKYLEGED
jgi:hypothetical protein